ncbi:MAG: ABC transporter ATP-binding protein [Planctomycetota bacterium]
MSSPEQSVMTESLVHANGLRKSFQHGKNTVDALANVELDFAKGECVSLLGRSGSGKTTLLNILAGLDRPSAGDLVVGDFDLSSPTSIELDEYRRTTVGVVFQQFRLIKHKTAIQNVMLPLSLAGVPARERRKRATECLRLVGLGERQGHRPAELSGGEQQRVAVARAISTRPKLLLADEPTGNLDSANAEAIMDLLVKAQREVGATLLFITHDQELAERFGDRLLRIDDGVLLGGLNEPKTETQP